MNGRPPLPSLIQKTKERMVLCLHSPSRGATEVLFAYLIIRTFQLVFLAETVFFSHNKSTRTVFRLVFSAKRTGPE